METAGLLIIFVGIIFFIAALALAIFLFIFWILMIIDCAKREFKGDEEKIVWILVLIFINWLGALIYYFAVKRGSGNGKKKTLSRFK
jgi:tellurite resistance protein TehA-like permease